MAADAPAAMPSEDELVAMVMEGLVHPQRVPPLKRPSEVGLAYEDVFFPSADGVPLDGWFMPADGAAAAGHVVVCGHFGPACRWGYPGDQPGYIASGGVVVDFLPKYKALAAAGFDVVAFDMRNHGASGSGNGGVGGSGLYEWRDVVGAVRFVKGFAKTKGKKVSLHVMCLSLNSTLYGMHYAPEEFADVACVSGINPVVGPDIMELMLAGMGVKDGAAKADPVLHAKTGFHVADYDVRKVVPACKVPVLLAQTARCPVTNKAHIEEIFAALPNDDKKMEWIDSDVRHVGYQHYSDHPEALVAWHKAHA